jgi:hypothetical protein
VPKVCPRGRSKAGAAAQGAAGKPFHLPCLSCSFLFIRLLFSFLFPCQLPQMSWVECPIRRGCCEAGDATQGAAAEPFNLPLFPPPFCLSRRGVIKKKGKTSKRSNQTCSDLPKPLTTWILPGKPTAWLGLRALGKLDQDRARLLRWSSSSTFLSARYSHGVCTNAGNSIRCRELMRCRKKL